MLKTPHPPFETIEDALEKITNHSKNFHFQMREDLITDDAIIYESIQSNIFRGLRAVNHRPSDIYRKWAKANFDSIYLCLQNCQVQEEFDILIRKYTNKLLDNWKENARQKLVYGPASKIINLLIKTIQESKNYKIESITRFQHIPWDSYTLLPLRNVINELSNTNFCINIPKNASMSFINSPELYNLLRVVIFNLYKDIPEQPPIIYYDYFAWNSNH